MSALSTASRVVHDRPDGPRARTHGPLKSLIGEPVLHFFLIALAIFAVHGLLGGDKEETTDSIVVTAPKIEQMATLFARTWQRQPSADELKGLIDDYVKEEILVRQALALGLDKDDTVVRRRLRQKMEFLTEAETPTPTEGELDAYLKANSAAFEIDAMLAFEQVFLNPERHGHRIGEDAAATLDALRKPDAEPGLLGDATMLPAKLSLSGKATIGQSFGSGFAQALDKAPVGQWTGPVASAFGVHLVRVTERVPGRAPTLDEVRDDVLREWTNARRMELEDQRLAELLKGYTVTIESMAGAEASQ